MDAGLKDEVIVKRRLAMADQDKLSVTALTLWNSVLNEACTRYRCLVCLT